MKVRLFRWRGSYAVRIPKRVVEAAKLREGDELSVSVDAEGTIKLQEMKKRMTLKQMVDAITPQNRHRPARLGSAVGKEIW
ncbi:MAG TPA: AbrB/MazE/SpoVT family DNA-binding domain-containing protein [Terriglobales bacterium]